MIYDITLTVVDSSTSTTHAGAAVSIEVVQVVGQVNTGSSITDGDKGDITVSGAGSTLTIDAGAVTLAKLADIATDTFLGRDTAGTGAPEALTPAQARTILNVANGATANATDASLRDRATHTGGHRRLARRRRTGHPALRTGPAGRVRPRRTHSDGG